MNARYTQNDTAAEIIRDLINIHNDRIAAYEQIIVKVTNLDTSLRFAFRDMIAKAEIFKAKLAEKMKDVTRANKKNTNLFGKIYGAWADLKMTFTGDTNKAVIAYCQYNEDIAQHAYKAALNIPVKMNSDIRLLIEDQQAELEKAYSLVKRYREELRFSTSPRLAYFN